MIITYKPEIDKLLKDVIMDLHYRGIVTKFSMTDYVELEKGRQANGYFDSEQREFGCALGKPLEKWLRTFLHESCHFDQWKENCDEWRAYEKLDKDEDLFTDWLYHKWEPSAYLNDDGTDDWKDRLVRVANTTRELERDCEIRTIEKIQTYHIDMSAEDYARSGWAYVTFYDYMLESRKWYIIGKEPYNNEALKRLMPPLLYKINSSILTDEMREIYKQCVEE